MILKQIHIHRICKKYFQGWFDALRSELGTRPITVTMVCPGPVFSNITEHAFTGKIGQVC